MIFGDDLFFATDCSGKHQQCFVDLREAMWAWGIHLGTDPLALMQNSEEASSCAVGQQALRVEDAHACFWDHDQPSGMHTQAATMCRGKEKGRRLRRLARSPAEWHRHKKGLETCTTWSGRPSLIVREVGPWWPGRTVHGSLWSCLAAAEPWRTWTGVNHVFSMLMFRSDRRRRIAQGTAPPMPPCCALGSWRRHQACSQSDFRALRRAPVSGELPWPRRGVAGRKWERRAGDGGEPRLVERMRAPGGRREGWPSECLACHAVGGSAMSALHRSAARSSAGRG